MSSWRDLLSPGFSELEKDVCTLLSGACVAADVGKPVKTTTEMTAVLCAAEDPFFGLLDQIDPAGDVCTVNYCGPVTVAYTGAPALGYQELVANGAGGVKPPTTAGTGRKYFVVSKDTTATTITFFLC